MAEAVPVVDVMPQSGGSNILEALALSGNGGMGGGNSSWLWIIVLILFMGGGNGFGGNNNNTNANLAVDTAVATAKNEAGLNFIGQSQAAQSGKLDQLIAGQYQNTQVLSSAICNLGYTELQNFNQVQREIADCCCKTQTAISQLNFNMATMGCELKQAIAAEGCATRALIQANTLQETRDALADAKLKLALSEQKTCC